MKTFFLTIVAFLSISCQTENIEEIISKNNQTKRMIPRVCEKKIQLQFDTEDLVINFGEGWQSQSINTFQLEWLDDNTLKIKSFYAIILASMQQTQGFSFQNYQITHLNPYCIIVRLDEPSLWHIYGEHYHMFNLNLVLDYCKPNLATVANKN